jgi:hypothetical protein
MQQQKAQAQSASSAVQATTFFVTARIVNNIAGAPVTLLLDSDLTSISGGQWQIAPPAMIPHNPNTPVEFIAVGSGDTSDDGLSANVVYKITNPATGTEISSATLTFHIPPQKGVPNQADVLVPLIYVGQVTGLDPWSPILTLNYLVALP